MADNETGAGHVEDTCPPLYDVFALLTHYYIPLICLVGLLGNLLSCVVFLGTHLRLRSSSYYLAALATADFGFLSVLLLVYLSNETSLELFNRRGWCQALVYASSVCSVLSVWLIVAFTVERFIAVQYPLQRPHMCTVSRAKSIVAVLTCVAMASQTYSLVTAGMRQAAANSSAEVCEMLDEYADTMRVINMVDTLVTLIGPVALIVVMNAMIARNLFLFRRRFVRHGTLDECLVYHADLAPCATLSVQRALGERPRPAGRPTRAAHSAGCADPPVGRCTHVTSSDRHLISTRNQQNITKMLLLISSVFILLNLPSYAIRLYVFFFFSLWSQSAPVLLWCVQQMVMVLYYTHFSVNFLLYAVCGVTFRRCLVQLLRGRLTAVRGAARACGSLHHRHRADTPHRPPQSSSGARGHLQPVRS